MFCVSPKNDNEKCDKKRIGTSLFCKEHSIIYKPLYLKYKRTEATISNDIITNINNVEDVYDLLKCYSRLESGYKQRINFRSRAFTIENWDLGHKFKINKIISNMKIVINRLEILFNKIKIKILFNKVKNKNINIKEKLIDCNIPNKIINVRKRFIKVIKQEEDFEKCIAEHTKKVNINIEKSKKLFHLADLELQKLLGVPYIHGLLQLYILINNILNLCIFDTTIVLSNVVKCSLIDRLDKSLYVDKSLMLYFKDIYKKILTVENFIKYDTNFFITMYKAYKEALFKKQDIKVVLFVFNKFIIFCYPEYKEEDNITLIYTQQKTYNIGNSTYYKFDLTTAKNQYKYKFLEMLKVISSKIINNVDYHVYKGLYFKIANNKKVMVKCLALGFDPYASILADVNKKC